MRIHLLTDAGKAWLQRMTRARQSDAIDFQMR